MQNISLASRYRPQTFADVAGQDMVKAVLSRAAAEDKVAPAYLFSGTRGVGKTTIARIFAKALNCAHAPAADPCNACEQCRKITQGVHVDVAEIDGASNNSVEDARALREKIGYAPMEGRYKVFIIDEAHMLSRSAFNALLKTLEEPPARVVFIFATTEAHKFPITIVSRCQHFIFRHLPESAIAAHLTNVLERESVPFEAGAVRLLARRAAGSVRDSMSLLDQTLALGGDRLTQDGVRAVLGLAGQEAFTALLDALLAQDCAAVAQLLRGLLDQGVDIGFFLRELANIWRMLFLLRQSGERVLPVLELPEDEARVWMEQAPRFSLPHIHAAWQMVLDAQRRIIQSPEPAAALELLLLHLALLPRLLPLDRLPGALEETPHSPAAGQPAPARASTAQTAGASAGNSVTPPARRDIPTPAPAPRTGKPLPPPSADRTAARPAPAACSAPAPAAGTEAPAPDGMADMRAPLQDTGAAAPPPDTPAATAASRSWDDFCAFCAREQEEGRPMPLPMPMMKQAEAVFSAEGCQIATGTRVLCSLLEKNAADLSRLLAAYCGRPVRVTVAPPAQQCRTDAQLKEEFAQREEIQRCCDVLDATLVHCEPLG